MLNEQMLVHQSSDSSPNCATAWIHFVKSTYDLRVVLTPEAEGYSACVARLPGVVSEGDTEEEAIQNIRDAFIAVATEYLKESGSIPWTQDEAERSRDSFERRILVDV